MNLLYTLLAALPLGLFVPRRHWALLAYLVTGSFLFTFQSLGVLLTWMAGDTGLAGGTGFGEPPTGEFPVAYSGGELTAYGVVNLVITLVGIGLVLVGSRLRARRAGRLTSIDLDRPTTTPQDLR